MLKRLWILILIVVLVGVFSGACQMLDEVLTYDGNSGAQAEGEGAGEEQGEGNGDPGTEAPAPSGELIYDSEWWAVFAADGNNFDISDVSDISFSFTYMNLYNETQFQGVAEFKGAQAIYETLIFKLNGVILTTNLQGYSPDSKDRPSYCGEFWRAFPYKEIDPRPLAEDKTMIPQSVALKDMEAAIQDLLEEGMMLAPAGAVEIIGQPCWTFKLVKSLDLSFVGELNYAVSREGLVFLRNDYLLQYVIQPYTVINVEKYLNL